jgi:predicted PolB exonuclease-like 3'-5' exonuclease
MNKHVVVWDLETVPDLAAVSRIHGIDERDEEACRKVLGEKFPKLVLHKIVAIGALVAEREAGFWQVRSLSAEHAGERTEREMISSFVEQIEQLRPRLVSFNGASFDLPVLRYRAMVNSIAAPGLACRPYFHRYTDDCFDLCDVLASYDSRGKVGLHELCCAMGFPGKPAGMDGASVDEYHRAGRIAEVASYCEADVLGTYRVWLAYEVFRGALAPAAFDLSEKSLFDFLRGARKESEDALMFSDVPVELSPP